MSLDLAAVALGAVCCGAAGVLVPPLIRRIPEPAPEADHDSDPDTEPGEAKTPYAVIAAEPHLSAVSVLLGLVAGAVVGASVGLAWPLLFLLPLVPVGVALGVVDLRTRLLPTVVVWPTFLGVAVLGCLSAALEQDRDALVRAGLGAVVVFVFFYVLWWVHPPGMGFGDVRLSAVLGFALGYVGWAELVVGVYGAFLAFALPGLLFAVLRRDRRVLKVAYPFGPFLLVGALVGLAVGEPVWTHLVSG